MLGKIIQYIRWLQELINGGLPSLLLFGKQSHLLVQVEVAVPVKAPSGFDQYCLIIVSLVRPQASIDLQWLTQNLWSPMEGKKKSCAK